MNIIILGPQASGKGTQAEFLTKEFNMFYFEAGAFLRNLAKTDSEIKNTIDKGELLPDEKMFELVKSFLQEQKITDNILFDGYPRSIKQYELLLEYLNEKKQKIDLAISLTIPDEESVRRLSARRIDPKTGQIYNLITNPPAEDVDVSTLIQRDDDKIDAIKMRLANYHARTEPLLEKLRQQNLLNEVDGTKSIKDLKNIIFSIVKNK